MVTEAVSSESVTGVCLNGRFKQIPSLVYFLEMNSVTLGFLAANPCLMTFCPAALGIITVHAESTGLASSWMMMDSTYVNGILLPIIIERACSLVFSP